MPRTIATANLSDEKSSCCNANVTYFEDGTLYCKACHGEVVWA